jgi:hypothetical protein
MTRILKLMADYDCFPIWEVFSDGIENITPDSLPISDDLKKDLHTWSDVYDQTLNIDDPESSGFVDAQSEQKFEIEGKRLWSELRSQLQTTCQILYFSEIDHELKN